MTGPRHVRRYSTLNLEKDLAPSIGGPHVNDGFGPPAAFPPRFKPSSRDDVFRLTWSRRDGPRSYLP